MVTTRSNRSGFAIAIVAAFCALSGAGCSNQTHDVNASGYRIGDQVLTPPLTYTVIETTWKNQLGEFPTPRMPERNFLLVRLSVTNGGGSEIAIPFLTLVNAAGESYKESQDGQGIDSWLGLLRTIRPSETETGWILFDAPTNSYRLRIPDTQDVNGERAAYVDIPLRLD